MDKTYHINGTEFYNPPIEYLSKETYPNFQLKLEEFKLQLKKQVENGEGKSYFKFGDGDYFFLKRKPRGSAKPGNRALSKGYWRINHKEFIMGSKKNDYFMCEITEQNTKYFREIFNFDANFPAEFVYGLLSNKWLFENFKNQIGLIGANEKIEIIKELMRNEQYQEYLGLEEFNDYISIPQKFACDDIESTRDIVKKQIQKSSSKIFLLGVGHVKSGLTNLLPEYKNAIYLDVGSGIDAIAGIIDNERPYFYLWKNFKLKNDDIYKNVDFLHFKFNGSETVLP
tara:strand:- start:2348 stop:3199 length:852 start_codon:yes stop_codon:yes gene_type:complete